MSELWSKWKSSGAKEDYDSLYKSLAPTINTAVYSYAGGTANETVKQRAKIMAHDAIQSYDPKKGASLPSHIMLQLRPLQRYTTKISTPLYLPEKRSTGIYQVQEGMRHLMDALGRDPTDDELADHLGLSKKRLATIRKSQRVNARPMVSEEGGLEMDMATDTVSPEQVWIDYVYHDMDPINKKIMEWKLGLYGNQMLSNSDIAKKLRMTASAVSQRTNTIISRLREFDTIGGAII